MTEITGAETFFEQDYWNPPEVEPRSVSQTRLGASIRQLQYSWPGSPPKLSTNQRQGVENRLTTVAYQMLEGNTFEEIPEGEQIGTEFDLKYALPGAVVLIDRETFATNSRQNTNLLPMQQMDEGDISLSAIECLLHDANRRRAAGTSTDVLQTYHEKLTVPGKGSYFRDISLFGFCLDIKGNLAGVALENMEVGGRVETTPGWLGNWFTKADQGIVGKTKIMASTSTEASYERIREARLCQAGLAEPILRSRAKKIMRSLKSATHPTYS